mmetsp:Transcript_7464/g.12617  ORF Transcript_7464/g.12617 Transcript_7464/m.12617 type:complete len:261 (-) Transcript_7464:58-840(-)
MKISSELVVFITGGASGLGEATVRRLHAQGCKISVVDVDEGRMQMLQDELKTNFIWFKCDVTKEEQVRDAVYGTKKEYGTIHVLLASAGVVGWTPILTKNSIMNTKKFVKMFEINVFGSVYAAKYCAEVMKSNKPQNKFGEKGLVLFISSIAGEDGQRGIEAYSGTKGAINAMMLPMARSLGKFGIRAVAIAPGVINTPITKKTGSPAEKKVEELFLKDSPIGRSGEPFEFAHFAQSVIENAYVNGVHLRIDGGMRLGNL